MSLGIGFSGIYRFMEAFLLDSSHHWDRIMGCWHRDEPPYTLHWALCYCTLACDRKAWALSSKMENLGQNRSLNGKKPQTQPCVSLLILENIRTTAFISRASVFFCLWAGSSVWCLVVHHNFAGLTWLMAEIFSRVFAIVPYCSNSHHHAEPEFFFFFFFK